MALSRSISLLNIDVLRGQVGDAKKSADDAKESLKLARETIINTHGCQRDVAALDAKYIGESADAKATIAQLERDVACG